MPGKQKPPCHLAEGMVAEQSFYPLWSSLFLQANVCKINENNRFYQYFPGMFLGFSPNALFQILVSKKSKSADFKGFADTPQASFRKRA